MNPIQVRNLERAKALHPALKRLLAAMDAAGLAYALTTTHRGAADQEAAKASGNSHAHFGQSPHNYLPALAFDAYPLIDGKVDVNDAKALDAQAARIKAIAAKVNIDIVWGGDWHSIIDRPHFELSNWRELRGKPE